MFLEEKLWVKKGEEGGLKIRFPSSDFPEFLLSTHIFFDAFPYTFLFHESISLWPKSHFYEGGGGGKPYSSSHFAVSDSSVIPSAIHILSLEICNKMEEENKTLQKKLKESERQLQETVNSSHSRDASER